MDYIMNYTWMCSCRQKYFLIQGGAEERFDREVEYKQIVEMVGTLLE